MLLRKTLSLHDVQLKLAGDGASGTFSGYASVFNGVDSYKHTILPGAFDATLKRRQPKMFYNHDRRMPIGKYPVLKEDAYGLYCEGELTPGLSLAGDVHAAMRHGTLDGLSIGGYIKAGDYEEKADGSLIIKQWSDLVEISPVVFPADDDARVTSVKGADILEAIAEAATVREIEQLLRDAAGLSKGAAAALVARVKAVVQQGEPAAHSDETNAELRALVQRMQRLAA